MSLPAGAAARPDRDPTRLAVACYGGPWRTIVAGLLVASRLGVPALIARLVLVEAPLTVPQLAGLVALLLLGPGALAIVLRRSLAGTIAVAGDTIVIERRDVRVEIPASAIVGIVPWRVPLPTPGAALVLRSGRPFRYAIGVTAPSRLAAFLRAHAGATRIDDADPAFRHADAAAAWETRWWHGVLKFPVLGLLPTAVFFRAHQFIAYGGTFGQYYMYGLWPYLLGFLEHWVIVTTYLLLWAGLLRIAAEIVAWGSARIRPSAAAPVRRAVEIACRVLYYGGVPAMVALRFAP